MPTNEERKGIAARLRRFNSDEVSSYSEYLEKLDEIIGTNDYDETGNRIATLIEPEPERTCRNERGYWHLFECSNCGCEVEGGDEYGHNSSHGSFNYCPNCGARVINNAD